MVTYDESPALSGDRASQSALLLGGFELSEDNRTLAGSQSQNFAALRAPETQAVIEQQSVARRYEVASRRRAILANQASCGAEAHRERALAEHYGRLARQMTGAAYAQ